MQDKLCRRWPNLVFFCVPILVSCASVIGVDKESRGILAVYGNWCGPGHPRNNATPKPVDYVDAACMHHDQCYQHKGFGNYECDRLFREELQDGFGKYGRPNATYDFLRGWIPGKTASFDLMDEYFKLVYCKQN